MKLTGYKLIFLKQEYYLAVEEVAKKGETYLGFAQGISGIGRGFFVKYHDDSMPSRLSAICVGTHRIIASTQNIDGVEYLLKKTQVENLMPQIYTAFRSDINWQTTLEARKAAKDYANKSIMDTDGSQASFLAGYKFKSNHKLSYDIEFTYGDMLKAIEYGKTLTGKDAEISRTDYKDLFFKNLLKEKVDYSVDIEKEIRKVGSKKYIYIDKLNRLI